MAQNVNIFFPELANSQNEISILQPFLAIFLATTFISFTKTRFRRSFWGAEQVWTSVGYDTKHKCGEKHYCRSQFSPLFFFLCAWRMLRILKLGSPFLRKVIGNCLNILEDPKPYTSYGFYTCETSLNCKIHLHWQSIHITVKQI